MITCIKDQLKRDEGWRGQPYKDSRGFLTIGYGHNLDADGIPPQVGDVLLDYDIRCADVILQSYFSWAMQLDEVRKGVMQNLVFNMGRGTLGKFVHFLAAMQQGDWATAKAELLNSAANHEEPQRIGRLAEQLVTGEWQ